MSRVLHDIKSDLEGMPTDLWADLKQLVEDARPAAGTTLQDARERGAAVGATLVSHLPERVMEKVPDAVSDRLPGTTSHGSRTKKLLLLGGLAGLAAAGVAWLRRGSAPFQPAANAYPPAPARPTTTEDEALDLPVNDDVP
ncbi:MAG TPA: hypothetical protein VJ872_01340 [Nocardioides sp.]|nr:hypothetical protein [Nocardioides sp.]